jgi:tetratricopeptide (TPR) repeat protein
LAVAFCAISGNELWSPEDGYSKARAAALRALAINDRIAMAHVALGMVHTMFDWDWQKAETAFRTALDIDPAFALAHHWFGLMLINSGRPEAAIAPLRRAAKLDPLSPVIVSNVGRPYLFLERYDEGIAQLRKAFDVDPTFWIAHVLLSWTYAAAGRPEDSLAAADLAAKHAPSVPVTRMTCAEAHAIAGNRKIAKALLAELLGDRSIRYVSPYRMARVYLALGRISQAFEWLERSLKDRSLGSMTCLSHDPAMAPIRGDRRFRRYLAALNLTAGRSTRAVRRRRGRIATHRTPDRGRAG